MVKEGHLNKSIQTRVEDKIITLKNLQKVYFPQDQITKGELLQYYTEMAPLILPHLEKHPFVMVRYPEGITGDFFYQKECPPQAPEWVTRYKDTHSESGLTYIVCDKLPTLIYLINLGCIELHAWAASCEKPMYPEWAVFDLDPDPPSGIKEVFQVAFWIGEILKELNFNFLVKTSGASGVHILLPLIPNYTYKQIQQGIGGICKFLVEQRPDDCTIERSVKNRQGKVYLDYLQNGRGRTMAGIYSVRPTKGGQISTPLLWEEVQQGTDPTQFKLRDFNKRIREVGDLSLVMKKRNDFKKIFQYFSSYQSFN